MSSTASSSGFHTKSEAEEADLCTSSTDEEKNVCWICLEGDSTGRPLVQPCKCPRYCHSRCLARWQLQSAGTKYAFLRSCSCQEQYFWIRRESECDFCNERLPDWRQVLSYDLSELDAPAIMNVNFEGKTYSFEVTPGTSGYVQFTEAIRQAFRLPADSDLNITFTCDEPCAEAGKHQLFNWQQILILWFSKTGNLLTLQGPGAYDAAVYCASISAARRQLGPRPLNHSVTGVHGMEDSDDSTEHLDRDSHHFLTHHRSRTSIGIGGSRTRSTQVPVYRPQQFMNSSASAPGRPRHNRARSVFCLPHTSRQETTTMREGGRHPKKGWTKVAKKMRAIYNKLTHKWSLHRQPKKLCVQSGTGWRELHLASSFETEPLNGYQA